MAKFYKMALNILVCLVIFTSLLGFLCFNKYYFSHNLLPNSESAYPWILRTTSDADTGGGSSIFSVSTEKLIDYRYLLSDTKIYPHATISLIFSPPDSKQRLVDFSKYDKALLKIKCEPDNALTVLLHTEDPFATKPTDFTSYRISETIRRCQKWWSEIEIDLHHMRVPNWWTNKFGIKNSDQTYQLNKVLALSISASRNGPINTPSHVIVERLDLTGIDKRFLWSFIIISALTWFVFGAWFIHRYTHALTADIKNKMMNDMSLIVHKKLSMSNKPVNSELAKIVNLMTTEYYQPHMTLDYATQELGIGRNKLNKLLKDYLGLTFNSYLNKIRLLEAARILQGNENVNIAEIVYKLGFNNPSYFYKLFKNEYGCTPKKFSEISRNNNQS